MSPVQKLLNALPNADQLVMPGLFELTLIVWLAKSLRSSTATLWPSRFGDGSPIAFDRADEPIEFWSLILLAICALALASWVLVNRWNDLINTAPWPPA